MWDIQCGLGTTYTPEDLLRKLVSLGLRDKEWVLIRRGLSEKGIGSFVDALGLVHCKSEIEAYTHNTTPAWFTHADRWTVLMQGSKVFNVGALRRGQDMLLSEDLDSLLQEYGTNDSIDKGYVYEQEPDIATIMTYRLRAYKKEEEC